MRILPTILATGMAGLVAIGPAAAEVRVTFVNPRGFTDAALYKAGPVDQNAPALIGLRRILERAGQRLPAGQDLIVEVLDVDLAGYVPPWRPPNPIVRVMGSTTWPRIRLHYALMQAGQMLAEGDAILTDMTYLQRPAVTRSAAPLRLEEPMLLDWFADRFGTARQVSLR